MNSTFTFHKRHTNKKNVHIYYVRFRDPDTEERLEGLSTGCTSKGAAQNWAIEYLASGRLVKKSNMKFGDFAKDWFIWRKCPYVELKNTLPLTLPQMLLCTRGATAQRPRGSADNRAERVEGSAGVRKESASQGKVRPLG